MQGEQISLELSVAKRWDGQYRLEAQKRLHGGGGLESASGKEMAGTLGRGNSS